MKNMLAAAAVAATAALATVVAVDVLHARVVQEVFEGTRKTKHAGDNGKTRRCLLSDKHAHIHIHICMHIKLLSVCVCVWVRVSMCA